MTVKEISEKLLQAGIENSLFEARLLMSHFSNKSMTVLLAEPDFDFISDRLEKAVKLRCGRYPLQYIIGSWEFCGLGFEINESCLIPRQDTEVIVEYALKTASNHSAVLDLCTGTGCILGAVLKLSGNTKGTAIELSCEAASVAERNLSNLGLDCTVIRGDIRQDLLLPGDKYDLITCNPPYISKDTLPTLEPELSFEPESALTDGGDGLSLIEAAIKNYSPHLKKTGTMVIEHGYDQSDKVAVLAEEYGLGADVIYDYNGLKRGAALKFK